MGERVTRNQMTTVPKSRRYISNHTITSLRSHIENTGSGKIALQFSGLVESF